MPWTQLFKVNNFSQAFAKRRKGVFHVDPIIPKRKMYKIRGVFRMVDIPFIYKEKEIMRENNANSPYHKFPKGVLKKERAWMERVLKIRQGIESAKEKELKHRQESLNKRPYRGVNELIKKTMPFLLKQTQMKVEGDVFRKKSTKMVSDFVKEVPKMKNQGYGRRVQERVKNLMDDKILDTSTIIEAQKKSQREKQSQSEIKFKPEDKNKVENQLLGTEVKQNPPMDNPSKIPEEMNQPIKNAHPSKKESKNKKADSSSSSSSDEE